MVVPRRQLGVTVASAGLTASCKVFQLVAGEKQFTGLFFLLSSQATQPLRYLRWLGSVTTGFPACRWRKTVSQTVLLAPILTSNLHPWVQTSLVPVAQTSFEVLASNFTILEKPK